MISTASTMRLAFEVATTDVPKATRTRTYAMVRSAINRRVGLNVRKTMWSVQRVKR